MSHAVTATDSLSARLTNLAGAVPVGVVSRAMAAAAGAGVRAPLSRASLREGLTGLRPVMPAGAVRRACARATGKASPLRGRQGTIRGRVLVGLGVTLVVAANGGALLLAPAYADAVSELPGLGWFLSWSGLTSSDVSIIDVSTEHDGVRIHVSAAYADENQTVVVLDYRGATGCETMELTDQFGHTYQVRASNVGEKGKPLDPGEGVPGFAAFDPLTGPAAVVGARLTLHESDCGTVLGNSGPAPTEGPGGITAGQARPFEPIRGTWDVTFVLRQHPATHVQWASAELNGVTYRFPSVTITGSTHVEIQWEATGPAIAFLDQQPAAGDGTPPPSPIDALDPFRPALVDANGGVVTQAPGFGMILAAVGDQITGRSDYTLSSGRYRFTVHLPDGSTFERALVIP